MDKAEEWGEDKDRVADRAATLQVLADRAYVLHAVTKNLTLKVYRASTKLALNAAQR
jgi:hypothetical protein